MSPTAPAPAPALGGAQYLRLVGIGALIGIPAALIAVLFQALVHKTETLLWTDLPDAMGLDGPPWWLVLALPVVGALLVWGARVLLPGDGGHEPIKGLNAAPTAVRYAPGVALAAFGTLAFGGVLGPEAPLIALGSAVGMIFVGRLKLSGPAETVLSTSGSFSAVSALFGGPVVAGALLLEAGVAAGSAIIPVLLPGAVAAAVGYVLIVGLGSWSGIPMHGLSVPDLPAYDNTRVVDLLIAVAAGVVIAALVLVLRTVGERLVDLQPRFGIGPSLLLGALVVGLLALAVEGLGGNYSDVLFSGQSDLPHLLTLGAGWVSLAIIAAKALAYVICLGVGFRGGPIFPAIFIGVGVAILLGGMAGMSPTVALAIGTAAGMSAFSRLMFSSLVFVILIVGGTDAATTMPAATLAAASAWLVVRVADQRKATAEQAATAAA